MPMNTHTGPTVYAPREDSEMLAEAARRFSEGNILDMGCGSGICGLAASENPAVVRVTFADINPDALACAQKNAAEEKVRKPMKFSQTDLFSNVPGTFDTILFNPPYVPTDAGEKTGGRLEKALDGGPDGRGVLDRFLAELDAHLNANGTLLLLNSSRSAP
ncbi:MAG: methyltransferase, partial [Candidatus Micrarchaeota archaeon]|nr:methyltransferase [Candidatus Micrarchaeota archaeon]